MRINRISGLLLSVIAFTAPNVTPAFFDTHKYIHVARLRRPWRRRSHKSGGTLVACLSNPSGKSGKKFWSFACQRKRFSQQALLDVLIAPSA